MRSIFLCLLSTLGLSWCLACHSVQTLGSAAELPAATQDPLAPALDDTPNIRPLFYPGTRPNSLFAVFGGSASRPPSPPNSPQLSFIQNSAGDTVARETTSHVGPVNDIPNDFSTSAWAPPKFFTDLSAFNITHFASGRDNLEVVVGITPGVGAIVHADDASSWKLWANASTMLQLFYPKDSVNPARQPQGGSEFYAEPLDISKANNVTLEYKVFFPGDFDWVKGGKLPGLYGGHTRCSGGNPALDCFSTRLMWRDGGAGELYLYAPKDRQTPSLCMTPPQTVCSQTYGLSIARGSFSFSRGAWAHVSQTVVLNTPGVQDGGFILEVDGRVAINRTDVFYRDKPLKRDHGPTPFCDPNSPADDSLLGPLLGGLIGPGIESERDGTKVLSPRVPPDSSTGFVATAPYDMPDAKAHDSHVKPAPLEDNGDHCVGSAEGSTQETDDPVGFRGVFFSTFFGGHHAKFATPKDQFVWFKDFALRINNP